MRQLAGPILVTIGLSTLFGFAFQVQDANLGRVKKVSRAFTIYANDYDDLFPLGSAKKDGMWMSMKSTLRNSASDAQQNWSRAIQPYIEESGLQLEGPVIQYGKGEFITGMSFNGLLTEFAMNAVQRPDLVPVVWTPYGDRNVTLAVTNPVLRCHMEPRCHVSEPMIMGAMMMVPPATLQSGENILVATVDGQVRRVPAFGETMEHWRESPWMLKNQGTYYVNEPSPHGSMGRPRFFSPDRTE